MLKFKPQQTRKYYITASFILSLGFSLFFHETVHAEEPYNDPKGRLIVREFDLNSVAPKQNIVVCSDRPEVEIPRLQRFVDYVLADKNYIIIDGRNKNTDVSLNNSTLIYVGHYKKTANARYCLDKFSELYLALKQKINTENIRSPERLFSKWPGYDSGYHWSKLAPIKCLFFAKKMKDTEIRILLQMDNKDICSWSLFQDLFRIKNISCTDGVLRCESDLKDSIWKGEIINER